MNERNLHQVFRPLQKAFDAVGGQEVLLELRGLSYESSGERFEPAQGLNPAHDDIKASSFTLSLLCDVENDRLSFDWQREIFNPPPWEARLQGRHRRSGRLPDRERFLL